MRNLVNHLHRLIQNSADFGTAVVNTARDLGIDIGFDESINFDIFDDFPEEGPTLEQFRLIVTTGIVRWFRKVNKDADRIPLIRSAYEHMTSKDLLTCAEMQSYHTLMNLLHLASQTDQKSEIPDNQPVQLALMGYKDPELIEANEQYPPHTLLPKGQREF